MWPAGTVAGALHTEEILVEVFQSKLESEEIPDLFYQY